MGEIDRSRERDDVHGDVDEEEFVVGVAVYLRVGAPRWSSLSGSAGAEKYSPATHSARVDSA